MYIQNICLKLLLLGSKGELGLFWAQWHFTMIGPIRPPGPAGLIYFHFLLYTIFFIEPLSAAALWQLPHYHNGLKQT